MHALEVNTLQKNYQTDPKGSFIGLGLPDASGKSSISFTTEPGELFGLIGPDGAGKTTLFRILATLLLPDSGTAKVEGLDVVNEYKAIRRRVGYMPGRFSLYQDLTVEENLRFFATLFNTTVKANFELIRPIYSQIEAFGKRLAGQLSGGMKQKLALSCALIHKPSLLLLDEPTTGVDAVSRKEFWSMLADLKAGGMSILVSTPYMDEAVRCDRIAFVHEGRFLDIDTPLALVKKFRYHLLAVQCERITGLLNDLRNLKGVIRCHAFGESVHVTIKEGCFDANSLAASLNEMGHHSTRVSAILPGIEDCFLELTTSVNTLT